MDIDAIITVLTGVAGVTGGFIGGKRLGNSQAVSIAVDTVELLQVQVGLLTSANSEKDEKIADLGGRVNILESLVTQRAEVEAVHEEVRGVRTVVDRIAAKIES